MRGGGEGRIASSEGWGAESGMSWVVSHARSSQKHCCINSPVVYAKQYHNHHQQMITSTPYTVCMPSTHTHTV